MNGRVETSAPASATPTITDVPHPYIQTHFHKINKALLHKLSTSNTANSDCPCLETSLLMGSNSVSLRFFLQWEVLQYSSHLYDNSSLSMKAIMCDSELYLSLIWVLKIPTLMHASKAARISSTLPTHSKL
jgi:hypothetical protein